MRLSVIVVTRNRPHMLVACLDSIAVALVEAAPLAAEIVVVDNGSTDHTARAILDWTGTHSVPVRHLVEPRQGRARALNLACQAAAGELLAFTDDDCRLDAGYILDLQRHDAADEGLVLRGGRVELGDPTDLPFTINIGEARLRWGRALNSARSQSLIGRIMGCNMTMRRDLYKRVGPFDERFGPGSRVGSGDDADYVFRAYLAGVTLEYVPDMVMRHFHGRKTPADARALLRRYMVGSGALYAKHVLRDPDLCRPLAWDLKNFVKDFATGKNTCLPELGFSHADKVASMARGAFRYLMMKRI